MKTEPIIIFATSDFDLIDQLPDQSRIRGDGIFKDWLRSALTQAIESERERIRKSKIWKLVPDTPRMIMCSDKELDDLLTPTNNN